jgi:hypothetical protein
MRFTMIVGCVLCFAVGHSFPLAAIANENAELRESIVMIHAETVPKGIDRYFPAIVLESTNEKSILVSASWGAEPFPIPPTGKAIDSIHLLDSDEPVEIIDYDESLGIAIFQVNVPLKPWPASNFATPVKAGDVLEELVLSNKHYRERSVPVHRVKAVGVDYLRQTVDGTTVKVEGTLVFEGQTSGHPGTVFLQAGKLAAIYLNNALPRPLTRHALPAKELLERYKVLLAKRG